MKSLLVAFQFLTHIPVPLKAVTERDMGRSSVWFPVVGALLGTFLCAFYHVVGQHFPETLARVLTLVALILVSGAFHLDGLSDTVDGFYGGSDRDKALEIMRDPRAGAMGVIAIVCGLFLKGAVFLTLSAKDLKSALLVMPVVGHAAMVLSFSLPSVRPDGLCHIFSEHRHRWDGLAALIMAGAACGCVIGPAGLKALAAALLGTVLLLGMSWRKIRGVTGDVCGAANEVAEICFLLGFMAALPVMAPGAVDVDAYLPQWMR
ncbi:MAG: adenosylcobinamide-GDP ribazoletransferase [Planctomycetota bacterium]